MKDHEAMAKALQASGQYRVQRRLEPRLRINDSRGAPIYLRDVELLVHEITAFNRFSDRI